MTLQAHIETVDRRFKRTLKKIFKLPHHSLRLHMLRQIIVRSTVVSLFDLEFVPYTPEELETAQNLLNSFQQLIETKENEFQENGEASWLEFSDLHLHADEVEFHPELLVENIDESGDKIRHEIEEFFHNIRTNIAALDTTDLDSVIERFAYYSGQVNDRATDFSLDVEQGGNYALYFLPEDIEEIQTEFNDMLTYLSEGI
jgi:hypothetical protein